MFLRTNKRTRTVLKIIGIVLAVFVLINFVLFVVYKNRTYPGTKIQNHTIGSVSKSAMPEKLESLGILPETLRFEYEDQELDLVTSEVGITVDTDQTTKNTMQQRAWLPILNFFAKPKPEVVLHFDLEKFTDQTTKVDETFQKTPVNARIVVENGTFALIKQVDGYSLDEGPLQDAVQTAIDGGDNVVNVPVRIVEADVTESDLSSNFEDLKARQELSLQYRFGDKTRVLNAAEVAGLHEQSGDVFVVSESKIRSQIIQVGRGFGIGVQNLNETISATKNALELKKPLDFQIKEAPLKTYTYCTAVRGVDASELAGLNAKLASVFVDRRGWSAEGKIGFIKADSGCNFTVWLTAADLVPSFSAVICSAEWSCMVPPNVIINFDRWRGASSSWNQAGGTLDDYRSMVINHETGHWLGFYHKNCPGAGQAAPVMQQQSINLQGCSFNAWPLPSEVAALKSSLGI